MQLIYVLGRPAQMPLSTIRFCCLRNKPSVMGRADSGASPGACAGCFKGEITDLPADVRVEPLAHLVLLREKGFRLGRPEVDTLEGSKYPNMKELRVKVLKVQRRFALAFDPERKAVTLCGSAKSGLSQKLILQAAD